MNLTLARRAAVLILSVAGLVGVPAAAAQADTYSYPCDGMVVQHHANGSYSVFWYDSNGNWGELPSIAVTRCAAESS